jgi:poly(3-hydroxybutyrate) depolymerase
MPVAKLSPLLVLASMSLTVDAKPNWPELQLAEPITLSGLSSGAYMAGQYHLAFAEHVDGVAMLAAGPVYCAQNSLGLALEHCLNKDSSTPDLEAISTYLTAKRDAGLLAPLSALVNDKVWIYHGSRDSTVNPKLGVTLYRQYQQWVKSDNIALINDKAFSHTFPTSRADLGPCDRSEPPFLASCQYDAAGALLTHLLGELQPKSTVANGMLISINQHQLSDAAKQTLAETGYLYVPKSCVQGAQCHLHVSFHGCKQQATAVGEAYVQGTELNNYADNNHLVVLYPQTSASNINPFNPNACWDWWGYSGADYATKNGLQLRAVYQLVQAVKHGNSGRISPVN